MCVCVQIKIRIKMHIHFLQVQETIQLARTGHVQLTCLFINNLSIIAYKLGHLYQYQYQYSSVIKHNKDLLIIMIITQKRKQNGT